MTHSVRSPRAWEGWALLSYGFRPFFLGAALWAAFAMAIWIAILAGALSLPTSFDPISWHAHEFLFGYLGAVIAGFLLTAIPNWTGRLPIVGYGLGPLFALWLAGRIAIAISLYLPLPMVMAVDLALPILLGAIIAREIVAGKNWRNLIVLALFAIFALGNAVFHLETMRGEAGAQGYGLRIGLGAALMMIALIGGRILPSFTRNWLAKRDRGRLPAAPMQRYDAAALLVLLAALILWVMVPQGETTAFALALAGLLHAWRLARWAGERTWREPLVLVLHAGYFFLPLGALAMAAAILWPEDWDPISAQHLWMAGAIGLMTLAVMTRATLGHTGRDLKAGMGTGFLYIACVAAVLFRASAGFWPAQAGILHVLAGSAWIAAYGGFALIYGPLVLRRRLE